MLLYEQYLLIYLLGIFLIKDTNIKIVFIILCLDYLFDTILYDLLVSPIEYLISITFVEMILMFIGLPFVKDIRLRLVFSFAVTLTLLNPMFILAIDFFIQRDDVLSYYLYLFCKHSSAYANEILITYLLTVLKRVDKRTNFWLTFVACNYILVIATHFKEI